MKKSMIFLFIILFIPLALAINIKVEKVSSNEIMIIELDKPTTFNLKITNINEADNLEFYNLLGFKMFPIGTTFIGEKETKNIDLGISPIGEFNQRGIYTFQYFIRGQDGSEIKEDLTFRIVELKDVFEIGSGEIDPNSNSLKIYIQNKVNFDFKEINAKFNSIFFNLEKKFDLKKNERKEFEIQLNKEDIKKLMAGFYTLNGEISIDEEIIDLEGIIKFAEKDSAKTTEENSGVLINTKIIREINEGNVLKEYRIVVKKNIISRLFTSFIPEPDAVERQGADILYTWVGDIRPGETKEVVVKTNWLFPIIVVLLIVTTTIIIKIYSKEYLILRKKVSFVKAKGGEFALKVTVFVSAKSYIERVSIIDRLPLMVKVHNRFGGDTPSRINEKTRRIEWNFEKLEAGEVRALSYIIYSKMGIIGRFALPSATSIYERNGKIKESESNRAFFVSETKKGDIEEE